MRGRPMEFTDFGGGLDTKAAPYLLETNRSRDLLNVTSLAAGGIEKRNGLVTFAEPGSTLDSLYGAEAPNPDVMIAHGGSSLYGISTRGAVSTLKSGVNRAARWEWAQSQASGGQGPVYGMNGVDTPQQWDGAAGSTSDWTATAGTVPNGRFILLHQNFLYVAGVASNPSRLYRCAIVAGTGTDPRQWPAEGVVDLDPNDGDEITGLGVVGALLLVFKRRKIFAVYDPAKMANRRISDSIGAVSHRSIAETPAGTFFLAERGVWRTNGSEVELVSDAVEPTLAAGDVTRACGVYHRNHYYLSFDAAAAGANDTTLDFDLTLGSWWRHSVGSSQWARWRGELFSAKPSAPVVDRCFVEDVWQDNGVDYPWWWKCAWLSPSADRRRQSATPYYRKRLRQVRADGRGRVDLSLAVDWQGAETLLASDIFALPPSQAFGGSGIFADPGTVFAGGTTAPLARVPVGRTVARAFSPVLGATSDEPATVFSMVLLMTDRKD